MKAICLSFIVFVLAGCEMDLTGFVKFPEKLPDQRFNGEFTLDISSSIYGSGSHTYKFDGTTYAVFERHQSYASGYNLSYSGYEIEVSDGKFRERLWKNDDSADWSDWEDYHFDNEGDWWRGILEYTKK
jgi:hypothetical protein